jgi:hypothetical protein
MLTRYLTLTLGLLLAITGASLYAEQAKDFGDYSIHYVAFTTDVLTPDVAKIYNITRSRNRAFLNISVLKKEMGSAVKPVRAKVVASATNLSAQLKNFEMRELGEQGAIYYIAEAPISDRETLKFNVTVTPEGETDTYTFTFEQQFFTN